MATSQNGWLVVSRSSCDEGPFEGVKFPNGILAGDVAVVMRWHLRRYKATVEPIQNGSCWGWNAKKIAGSDDWSNHASGTAWDINAPEHPMGPPVRTNMSQREIDACHALERESGGVIRWGGDFSRPDPMHWEIIGSRSQVAAFADRIREDDVDAKDIEAIAQRVATILAPKLDQAMSAWDDMLGRGENRQSTAEILQQIKGDVAELKAALPPAAATPPAAEQPVDEEVQP